MLAVCALPVIALWISRGPGEGPASGGRGAEVELGPSARHRGAAWGEGGVDAPWGEPSGSLESERGGGG